MNPGAPAYTAPRCVCGHDIDAHDNGVDAGPWPCRECPPGPLPRLLRGAVLMSEEWARFEAAKRAGFTPPTGYGRCAACGFHIPTQGHRDGCPTPSATPRRKRRR